MAETWGAKFLSLRSFARISGSPSSQNFVDRTIPNLTASESDFLDGVWIERLDEFLALPKVGVENRTNGAKKAIRQHLVN